MEVERPGALLPVKEKNTLRAGVGVVPRYNPPRHCRGSTQPHLSAWSLLGSCAVLGMQCWSRRCPVAGMKLEQGSAGLVSWDGMSGHTMTRTGME